MNNINSSKILNIETKDYGNYIKKSFRKEKNIIFSRIFTIISHNLKVTLNQISVFIKEGLWLDNLEIMNQLHGKIFQINKNLNKESTQDTDIIAIQNDLKEIESICSKLKPLVSLNIKDITFLKKLEIYLDFSEKISKKKIVIKPHNNQSNLKKSTALKRGIFNEFIQSPEKIKTNKMKLLKYKVSLAYTIIPNIFKKNNNLWFQSIIDDKLTLGAIPLKNKGHLTEIPAHGVTAVLTALEDFEIETKTFFSKPISKKDWERNNIDYKFIDTPDFLPVSLEKIKEGVEWLEEKISNGKHVYVHCKAGRGRSATIVLAYLLKYGSKHNLHFKSVDDAILHVKSKRPVINMNPQQKLALESYYKKYVN